MDPERLRQLLELVREARAAGKSDREIDQVLRENRNVPVNSISQLDTEARTAGLDPRSILRAQQEDRSVADRVRQGLASLSQGALGSFGPDVVGGLEKIGVAPEGASERFRQDVRTSREEDPVLSFALQTAGLLGGAGRLGARAVGAGARAGGRLAARAAGSAARGLGTGELGQIAAREGARALGATAGGGTAGAIEGGLIGFGEAAGQPVSERVEEATFPALLGGAITGPASGLLTAGRSFRRLGQQAAQRGEVLAEAGERVGRDLPTRRTVSARVERANKARRAAFQRAEAAGQEIPGEVTDLLAGKNPIIRKAIRNAASQGSPEARRFLKGLKAVQKGEIQSIPAASFELADDVRKQLKFRGEAFQRQTSLLGASAKAPSQGAVREAQRLNSLLEESLEEVPGFNTAIQQSAQAGTQSRSFQTGRKIFSKPADVVEDIASGKKVQIGNEGVRIPDSQEAREAFRAGLAEPVLQRLRGGAGKAESFLSELESSSELRKKMRVILGSDEALQEFTQEANRLRAIGQVEGMGALLIKSAGFLTLGTSLFGSVLVKGSV